MGRPCFCTETGLLSEPTQYNSVAAITLETQFAMTAAPGRHNVYAPSAQLGFVYFAPEHALHALWSAFAGLASTSTTVDVCAFTDKSKGPWNGILH